MYLNQIFYFELFLTIAAISYWNINCNKAFNTILNRSKQDKNHYYYAFTAKAQ